MTMQVKALADLVGISVRTLHYYDEIGLLSPSAFTAAGYRLYSDKDIDLLQQILFFKTLGVPLNEIKSIIHHRPFDQHQALVEHQKMLNRKRRQLDQLIHTVNQSIKHLEGEIEMSTDEKFAGFDFSHNPYEKEARENWGDQAVDNVQENVGKMDDKAQDKMNKIYARLAEIRHTSPQSETAQVAIGTWFDFLNTHIGTYSLEAFKGLGQLYVLDERFTENIDQFGQGLAQFMCDAMTTYAERGIE